jgi:phage protein D/phage baseplate assembly protein gpV
VNLEQAASYDILVEGDDLSDEDKNRIKEIRIVDYLRLPDVCTVDVAYPRGEGLDSQPFDIGKEIEVRLGAPGERAPETLFKGRVVSLESEFGAGGCSVQVRAYDRSHLLHRSRRARTFQNQTASDIVERIAKGYGLTAKCEPSGEPYDFFQQDNETDWDLIWRLCERHGCLFIVEGGTAYFGKPSADGAVELVWPETLRSFRPRVTSVQQVNQVTLLAHDPKTKQAIESSASRPEQIAKIGVDRERVAHAFENATLHVATEPVKSKAEGDAIAQALLDKLANGYIAAEGVAPGNPKIKAGSKVNVSGVGGRFSGTYLVAMSMHVLRGGSYETFFANSASHTILGAVGSDGSAAPVFGSQVVLGVVTNNADPDGMGRVRVRYPAFGDEVESAWARIATPSAGKERGLLMLPVVGEEVLVAFEHDDTRRPYVLGSLFNGRDVPGDDLLQGKDGSFAMKSDKKAHLESKEDFTIKSGAKLTVEISDAASMKAGQSFEIEGQNVSIKGNAQVTIEGTSTLELKCGAASIELSSSGVRVSGPMISFG